MAKRKCPVCRQNYVIRADLRTCSRTCSQEYITWDPQKQAKKLLEADEPVLTLEELFKKGVLKRPAQPANPDDGEYEDDNQQPEPQFDIDKILPPKKD